MQQTTQIQTTILEITATNNEKKPNRLVGFFSGCYPHKEFCA